MVSLGTQTISHTFKPQPSPSHPSYPTNVSLLIGWSPWEHKLFPIELRDAVRTMLLCQNDVGLVLSQSSEGELSMLEGGKSLDGRDRVKEGDDGNMDDNEDNGYGLMTSSSSVSHPNAAITSTSTSGGSNNRIMCWGSVGGSEGGLNVASSSTISSLRGKGNSKACASSSTCEDDDDNNDDGDCSIDDDDDDDNQTKKLAAKTVIATPSSWQLRKLPKHVVYNILEYLHWDWFEVTINTPSQ